VGASSRSIFVQFLAEATAVCGLSGLLGAGLGVGFTRIVTALAPPDGPFSSAPILSPWVVAVIVISLVGVGIVAGLVPAVRASLIPPAEALRAGAG
jgi:putative ABC transport system permease protein